LHRFFEEKRRYTLISLENFVKRLHFVKIKIFLTVIAVTGEKSKAPQKPWCLKISRTKAPKQQKRLTAPCPN
jgi:hypothetical protein